MDDALQAVRVLLVGSHDLRLADWAALFGHFLLLSLLAIGGAITTAPDMQRFVVGERHWLTEAQFNASVALAQAAPGPNVLFVAVVGYNVGGLAGAFATMVGTLLPSTLLTLRASHWNAANATAWPVRALHAGLAPVTIGLLLATGWILFEPQAGDWASAALALGTIIFMLRTRLSPMWPIACGAIAGAAGWIG
ncbi:MAG: chromate transporter [Betaproteobacteria bacterium]|nr:chromate transporter [Betaproteobacteria bacterium]